MVERGGPASQVGIYYQNSVAALFLGDPLRWDVVNPAERVVEVRLDAPGDDDIVARFADGHRDWVQVKTRPRAARQRVAETVDRPRAATRP